MATPKLNTGSSVVDFLKSTGKPADFSSRKSLYETSGLRERLGDYTGSPAQNVAFLKQLQTSTGPTLPATTPVNTTGAIPGEPTQQQLANREAAVTGPTTETPGAGMGAYDALSALGYNVPSPDEIAGKALESTAFKTFQEGQGIKGLGIESKAAEEKAALEGKAAADTEKTIQSFGSRGLFFSGMREEAVNDIVDALASSKLGVDRDVAQKLLEQGQATKEEFIKIASDIAKDAQEGNKQALSILEKQGLTIGLDGKTLVPTLSAVKEELAQAQRDKANAIAESRLALSEEAGVRADENLRIANERLRLAEEKAINSSSNDTTYKFSSTQTNKGSANSGLSISQFKTLPGDVQNFYVNLSSAQTKDLNTLFSDVKSEALTPEAAKEEIDSKSLPPEVKDYLKTQVDLNAPTKPTKTSMFGNPFKGGLFKNAWEQIKYLTTGK